MNKIIAQGAEATIYLKNNQVIKQRTKKSYRIQELDEKIRKSRTKREAKILKKSLKIIKVPKILKEDSFSLILEYIEGDKLSETLNSYDKTKQKQVMKKIGKNVAKLHQQDIIHGDLTTSNILLKEKEIYILDFGLGYISPRIEDKAVDLH